MRSCNLTERSSNVLASVISSASIKLKLLDLSDNELQDEGVKNLCGGLGSPHCKLEILRWVPCVKLVFFNCKIQYSAYCCRRQFDELSGCLFWSLSLCGLTEESCTFLASALNLASLRELDLSYNHPGKSGLELLSALVDDPNCSLQKVR